MNCKKSLVQTGLIAFALLLGTTAAQASPSPAPGLPDLNRGHYNTGFGAAGVGGSPQSYGMGGEGKVDGQGRAEMQEYSLDQLMPGTQWADKPNKIPASAVKYKMTPAMAGMIKKMSSPRSGELSTNSTDFVDKMMGAMAGAEIANQPEAQMQAAKASQQAQASEAGNSAADVEKNQSASAIDFCASFLTNFTVDKGNKWNKVRDNLFVPMGILLLLPGALLTQIRSIIAAGSPVLGESNPWEGIQRSLVAVFLIPGTYLVVNYSIDLSNSITYTINSEYFRLFGSDMYRDAICAQIRAFPSRQPSENRNALDLPVAPMGPLLGGATAFAKFEGMMIEGKIEDPCLGIYLAPAARADEALSSGAIATKLGLNASNAMLATSWNILCAFQMAYLYYLWFVGPVVAGLWVWPMKQLRNALPSWVEGVVTLAFWALFWNTTILLMACFKGVDETGTIIMSALNFLATSSVKFAFDFAGLVRAAGQEAASMAEKAMKGSGAGAGGGGGGGGGGCGGGASAGGASGKGAAAAGLAGTGSQGGGSRGLAAGGRSMPLSPASAPAFAHSGQGSEKGEGRSPFQLASHTKSSDELSRDLPPTSENGLARTDSAANGSADPSAPNSANGTDPGVPPLFGDDNLFTSIDGSNSQFDSKFDSFDSTANYDSTTLGDQLNDGTLEIADTDIDASTFTAFEDSTFNNNLDSIGAANFDPGMPPNADALAARTMGSAENLGLVALGGVAHVAHTPSSDAIAAAHEQQRTNALNHQAEQSSLTQSALQTLAARIGQDDPDFNGYSILQNGNSSAQALNDTNLFAAATSSPQLMSQSFQSFDPADVQSLNSLSLNATTLGASVDNSQSLQNFNANVVADHAKVALTCDTPVLGALNSSMSGNVITNGIDAPQVPAPQPIAGASYAYNTEEGGTFSAMPNSPVGPVSVDTTYSAATAGSLEGYTAIPNSQVAQVAMDSYATTNYAAPSPGSLDAYTAAAQSTTTSGFSYVPVATGDNYPVAQAGVGSTVENFAPTNSTTYADASSYSTQATYAAPASAASVESYSVAQSWVPAVESYSVAAAEPMQGQTISQAQYSAQSVDNYSVPQSVDNYAVTQSQSSTSYAIAQAVNEGTQSVYSAQAFAPNATEQEVRHYAQGGSYEVAQAGQSFGSTTYEAPAVSSSVDYSSYAAPVISTVTSAHNNSAEMHNAIDNTSMSQMTAAACVAATVMGEAQGSGQPRITTVNSQPEMTAMTESRHQLAAQSVRDQQVFATHQQAASYQAPLHQEASSYQVATSYQQASNVHQAAQAPQHLEVRMEQAQRLIEKMNAIMATFDAPAAAINHSVSQVAQNEVIHQGVHEVYSVPMTHISQAASIDYDRAVAIENVYNAPVAHSEVTHATSAQQAANGWQPAEDANQQVRMTANMAAVAGATRLASATGNAPPVVPAASTVAPRPARVSRLTLAMGRATTKQASPPPLSTSVEGPVKV